MVSKVLWAALFFTPAVLGAALPEVQENVGQNMRTLRQSKCVHNANTCT